MTLESDLIGWLEENLPSGSRGPGGSRVAVGLGGPGGSRVAVGLGDDAAVLAGFERAGVVVTTDLLTEGVDFLIEEVTPEQVGHKALGVNLSDLAAMAARPVAAFVSLVLPRSGTLRLTALELAIGIYRGMLPLAERMEVTIAGGDTNSWEGPLAISVTAVGETTARGPLVRSGGQVGDQLLVTGQLGGSILGRHLQVEPRVREALLLHEQYELHAGIDISDGLALDCSRLAKASVVGAALELDALPISEAARRLSEQDGRPAVEHALGDGEDFELILAVPGDEAERLLGAQPLSIPLTRIGELVNTPGLWQVDAAGERTPLEPHGYQHLDEI